jgi:TIR domain-containing protein
MAGRIFINYRRGDEPGYTQALYHQLERELGRSNLFMDVEGYIKAGDDFVSVLDAQVARSDALLVIIGPRWVESNDDAGRRRLDNPEDFVRIEIAAALEQGKRIIPVLVNGAPMPRAEELPDPLKPIARRNAVRLTHDRFKSDVQGLIAELKQIRGSDTRSVVRLQENQKPVQQSGTGTEAGGRSSAVKQLLWPPLVLALLGAVLGLAAYGIATGVPITIPGGRSIQALPSAMIGLAAAFAILVWGNGGIRSALITGVLAGLGWAAADWLIVSSLFTDTEWNGGGLPLPKQFLWGLTNGLALLGALAVTQPRSRTVVVWLATLMASGASAMLFSFTDLLGANGMIAGAVSFAATLGAMGLAFLRRDELDRPQG